MSLELVPDAGGGKGWPTNASVVLYHRESHYNSWIDSGAVYAYGDGFQYMKAPEDLQDPKAVIFRQRARIRSLRSMKITL